MEKGPRKNGTHATYEKKSHFTQKAIFGPYNFLASIQLQDPASPLDQGENRKKSEHETF